MQANVNKIRLEEQNSISIIESYYDDPKIALFNPELEDINATKLYSREKLILPKNLLLESLDPVHNKGFFKKAKEDKPLFNSVSLNKENLKAIEKTSPFSSLIGNLALSSFTKDPNFLISKPNLSIPLGPWPSQSLKRSIFNDEDLRALQPEDLPELALPILEFIENTQPHIVIGCDRGGRLFSLAIHAAWRQTRGGQPFPTVDGKIHFARISKSEDTSILQDKVDEIVSSAKQEAARRGNEIGEDEQLRVMFIDDWVIGGGTMRLAKRLTKKYGAKTFFAVMCGVGADATGQTNLNTTVSWHDRPEEIGVNYLSLVSESEDGSIVQTQKVSAVHDARATSNRRRIQAAAKAIPTVRQLYKAA